MLLLIALYGLLALLREFCAVKYYGCVFNGWAFWASALSFTIEVLDCTALVMVFDRIHSGWGPVRAMIPLLVYGLFGGVGTYVGVKHNHKRG